ncbi:hypothetical protein [Frankia sp. Cas3]|nr:hypothetical protein [Frankia sp. Cas3]
MTTESRTLRDLPDIAPVRSGEQLPWDRLAATCGRGWPSRGWT